VPQGKLRDVRRNKFEIWAEVLEACARNARTQSWLLRKVGLKTRTTKEVIYFLQTVGLIEQLTEFDNGYRSFRTTRKGESALIQYYELISKFFTNSENKVNQLFQHLNRQHHSNQPSAIKSE
jgi:predicted transcriptional regulator